MGFLNNKQFIFTQCVARLIQKADELGFDVSIGDAWRPDKKGHKNLSWHYIRLAIDLNLFKNGVYLTSTDDHKPLGEYWESLHPGCTWGGHYDDGNHYSFEETREALNTWRQNYK